MIRSSRRNGTRIATGRRSKQQVQHTGVQYLRPADELLLAALRTRWRVLLKQLGRCRRRCPEPAVHDLRVATRRCMAAIDLLMSVPVSPGAGKARQQLKKLLKFMGPLRDTQVQILLVRKEMDRFPELEPLLTILLLREQRYLKRISSRMGTVQLRVLRQGISSGMKDLQRLMRMSAIRPVLGLALQGALGGEFIQVVELRHHLNRLDPATIHRMRVAFKRFRYAIEILRPDIEARVHDEMNAFQTRMGDIHDLEVLHSSVERLAGRAMLRQRARSATQVTHSNASQAGARRQSLLAGADLAMVGRRLQRRSAMLAGKFIATADEVYGFYRPETVSC